ncbi:MAG: hypothetical protein LBD17_00460 [Endomicrobium sp.]|nr:hypothetical protein [Endomicrobium sp.]
MTTNLQQSNRVQLKEGNSNGFK